MHSRENRFMSHSGHGLLINIMDVCVCVWRSYHVYRTRRFIMWSCEPKWIRTTLFYIRFLFQMLRSFRMNIKYW